MKIKKALLSCLVLAGVLNASAQEQPQDKTEFVHNPYWYVQVQAGGQYTLGEIDFKDLISPNVQVAIGRQFTPVFGARLAVNAWQSRAGIEFGQDALAPGTTKWKWNYVAPGIDATFNLSNLFCGYNPNRIFNFSVFGGLGANIAWGYDKSGNVTNGELIGYNYAQTFLAGGYPENLTYMYDNDISKTKVRMFGRVGVAADFRVSNRVSIGLEVNANTLSDRYNGKKAGNWDWYFNALAGVKIDLASKRYTTRVIPAPKAPEKVIEKVIERIVEKPAAPQVVEPTRAVQQKKEPFRRDIFFTLSNTRIAAKEMSKVKEVAEYLKANPNATVEVTGYANKDNSKGRINQILSQRRAQAVYTALTKTYGIKASRIKVDYKGDTIQPFANNIDNRVAICIAE